jgi:hypothetical protein
VTRWSATSAWGGWATLQLGVNFEASAHPGIEYSLHLKIIIIISTTGVDSVRCSRFRVCPKSDTKSKRPKPFLNLFLRWDEGRIGLKPNQWRLYIHTLYAQPVSVMFFFSNMIKQTSFFFKRKSRSLKGHLFIPLVLHNSCTCHFPHQDYRKISFNW